MSLDSNNRMAAYNLVSSSAVAVASDLVCSKTCVCRPKLVAVSLFASAAVEGKDVSCTSSNGAVKQGCLTRNRL